MNTACFPERQPFLRKLRAIFPVLLAIVLVLPSVASAQVRSTIGSYDVSGPYHYRNLSVFLIHGEDRISGRRIVTLEEGLEQGIVKVYETGSVNELAIENLSEDVEVYIQAGDVVKGGRQDRTLGIDLTLAPNSGQVPIASFCVERGRWAQRGDEPSGEFTSSNAVVTSNALRLAIKEAKNQSEVWANVDVMQSKLSENVGVAVNVVGATVAYGNTESVANDAVGDVSTQAAVEPLVEPDAIRTEEITINEIAAQNMITSDEILAGTILAEGIESSALYRPQYAVANHRPPVVQGYSNGLAFASPQSQAALELDGGGSYTTSLQLSLENTQLIDEVEEYMAALRDIIAKHDDVIGLAFTINGEMRNADVYASGDLFERLWPKLLRAAATEAVSEQNGAAENANGSIEAVRSCFLDAESATAEEEEIDERMIMVTRRSEENILFETQEKGEDTWLHRNYMNLEFE